MGSTAKVTLTQVALIMMCALGTGTMQGPDGSVFTGGWNKDIKHGLGRKVYSNGDVYEVRQLDDVLKRRCGQGWGGAKRNQHSTWEPLLLPGNLEHKLRQCRRESINICGVVYQASSARSQDALAGLRRGSGRGGPAGQAGTDGRRAMSTTASGGTARCTARRATRPT